MLFPKRKCCKAVQSMVWVQSMYPMFVVLSSESAAEFEHFSFNTGEKRRLTTKKEHSYAMKPYEKKDTVTRGASLIN